MWVEKQKMLNSARITCDFLRLKRGDTALLCMSLDYIAGKMMVVRAQERGLRLTVVEPSNHPLRTLPAGDDDTHLLQHEEEGFDFVAMIPSQVFCSLQVPKERERLLRVRNLIIGGGAIPHELQQAIDQQFGDDDTACTVYSTYGMTETLSHIALRRLNGKDRSEWYTPFDGVQLSLADDGCLQINAPHVHDGVLKTNDIAEIRSDGHFRIIGRKDNVICSGGIKLQIEEIEETIRPYIPTPYCIARRADEKFGEVAILLVEGPIDRQRLFETLRAVLPPYSVPKDIIEVEKIPMTETGKIKRNV